MRKRGKTGTKRKEKGKSEMENERERMPVILGGEMDRPVELLKLFKP